MDGDLGFDLVQLQTFYAVARHGTVSAAARALGRSQPAISHRLRALQDGLGVLLFERVGRRLILTPNGDRLLLRCEDLFAMARAIGDAVRPNATDVAGRVRVGTYPTVASYLLVDVIERLLNDHPALSITLDLGLVGPITHSLRVGALDIVLIAGKNHAVGLDARPAGTDALVAVMAPEQAPRDTGLATLEELRALRYLAWVGAADEVLDEVHAYAAANGFMNDLTPVIPSIDTLRGLAMRGLGFALLPHYVVLADVAAGRLVALVPEGLDVPADFYLLTRPRQVVTPAVERVSAALLELPFGLGLPRP